MALGRARETRKLAMSSELGIHTRMSWYTKIFGDPSKKELQKLQPIVEKINHLELEYQALSDEGLREKTDTFKVRLQQGETLEDLIPEAFAAVREASRRTTGMRHFDVQLIGGMALHQRKIAEMRTGEGKTLVATLPAYLNALEGKGVHIVTVNDYLARRDAVWMGQIYDFLGMRVGIVQNLRISYVYSSEFRVQSAEEQETLKEGSDTDKERDEMGSFKVEYDYLQSCSRQEAYRCDITYGTNNEFGFDYLRDNMVQDVSEMVMRPGAEMHYAIVDEIDSILIDEARTPLIISTPAEEAGEQYYMFARLVRQLTEHDDFAIDEKLRSVTLTESGIAKFEEWLGVENLYVEGGIPMVHHIEQALKAEYLFKRDKEYVVDMDEILIIDEFTGRKMPGRRYSEGLHQAIEAKEGVTIKRESVTLATITFQNLFRMYRKLSGMTGTAKTEEEEFYRIYGLEVFTIPTNKSDHRSDHPDRIYRSNSGKYAAIVEKIKEAQTKSQPLLIGTISVEKNEELSAYLDANGIAHEILNAKNHEREGEIIAQAGRPGAVTLATNMAGRGVDIKLGGSPVNEEEAVRVVAAGGLFVLGTERHEARRIDNQLRGRAARQGDPGETQFFVSTEDDLMRIFAGDRMKAVMTRLKVPEDMPIEQRMITRMLESAQKKVEGFHFDSRKHVLQYDDVLNRHRHVIYTKRRQILEIAAKAEGVLDPFIQLVTLEEGDVRYDTLKDMMLEMIDGEIEFLVSFHTMMPGEESADFLRETKGLWDMEGIIEGIKSIFPMKSEDIAHLRETFRPAAMGNKSTIEHKDAMIQFIAQKARAEYALIEEKMRTVGDGQAEAGNRLMQGVERSVLIRAIDTLWVEHLVSVDYLRTGIGLRGYGQRDPLIEYKKEAYRLFQELLGNIQKEVVTSFFKIGLGIQMAPRMIGELAFGPSIMAKDKMVMTGAKKSEEEHLAPSSTPRSADGKKVGRNDPCPCESGRKYKKCHGK